MGSTFTRWTTGVLAVTAIAGGAAFATTLGTSAHASDTAAVTSTATACTRAHGKYAPHLLKSYKITGGDDSVHGIPGGTLQVWGSKSCKTIWVKTVKLKKYTEQPYLTIAAISFTDPSGHQVAKRTEKTTSSSVQTPAAHTPGDHPIRFSVQGGFVGPYQFDAAHTYRH